MSETILVSVTGVDGPGITAGLLHILDDAGARVLDMEQVVVRDRLNLGMLVALEGPVSPLKDMLFFAWERGIDVDFEVVDPPDDVPLPARYAVTVIGEELRPAALGAVADAIVTGGGNIERIARLSKYPVISYELLIVGGDFGALRSHLLHASSTHRVDIAIQREGLRRRAKRLVVIDVDSTLIRDEMIDTLAGHNGAGSEVSELTARSMAGDVDFERSLRDRVSLLEGLEAATVDRVAADVALTPGARTFVRTLRRLGFTIAIVSGGFTRIVEPIRRELGIDRAYANTLEIKDGFLTGRLKGSIVDGPAKAEILAEIAAEEEIPLEQTVAVGDGANDMEMLSLAGLGIAFNAKPIVGAAADTSLTVPYLDAILFLLGIRREEIEDADRSAPL